jgi:hypothetical protein
MPNHNLINKTIFYNSNHSNHSNHTHNNDIIEYVKHIMMMISFFIMIICYCGCYIANNQNTRNYPFIEYRYNNNVDNDANNANNVDNDVDNDVDNNIYENENENENENEEEICPICLDTLKEDLLRFKVCSHILHKECAEQCLRYNLLHCPVCRRYLYDRRANLIINV